jgi:nucleoside-diphosphate-sugar epimerase
MGGTGFLGTHVVDRLRTLGAYVVGSSRRNGVDARVVTDVVRWIREHELTHVINLAAECGGIGLNQSKPADLWLASTQINASVLQAARLCQIQKLTLVGTACSYAAECPTPSKESDLMHHGFPEYTNSAYGVAKLASFFGARAYRDQHGLNAIYLVPVNLYGPNDHFELETSHVIAALIRRFSEARDAHAASVTVWGTGRATREFLYAPDAAEAIVKATAEYDRPEMINIGSGSETSVRDLTHLIAELTGYEGRIEWDTTRPDGQLRRCLDTTRAREYLGWEAKTNLRDGLRATIEWYDSRRAGKQAIAC